jgi:hypothetical protein
MEDSSASTRGVCVFGENAKRETKRTRFVSRFAFLSVSIAVMAVPSSPIPVLRFAGLLAGSEEQLAAARQELAQWYGRIEAESEIISWQFTQYYQDEMGGNLLRQWVRFDTLFGPELLPKCKLETNMAETLLARRFADPAGGIARPINIDPGYVHKYKVILATTKDHSHRVYMREGIYAEVTLHWSQNKWTPWPWTYADYKSEAATKFFDAARAAYLEKLKTLTT